MTEEFEPIETILKAGSADIAAHTTPLPAAAVRARGDRLRRRRRTSGAALALALAAAVAGGMFAAGGQPSREVSPAHTTSTPSSTPSPTNTRPPAKPTSSCRSLVVPDDVKAAVTDAYRRSQTGLTHIAPVKGTFYYGRCGSTFYAGTRFTPTSAADLGEQVQLQDEGAAEKYFIKPPGGSWAYAASDGFPADPRGCAAITRIPPALAALWADCLHP